PHCREPHRMSESECRLFELDPADPPQVWAPSDDGCAQCNHTGYSGRSGIYELVAVDDAMRNLIHEGAGEQELEAHARQRGPGIRVDGLRRIRAGETSIEEVLRVTPHADRDSDVGI
ncbi:MAG: type II secretion system protein GspE, partial [Halofilum sp. (in: g-proteobacteria)]